MHVARLQPGRKTALLADARLVLAAAAALLGACAAHVEDHGERPHLGHAIQPIVNGTASGLDEDSVVELARFDNGDRVGLCTATLVAPNLVLTARHCVSASDASAACGSDGTPVVGAMLHGDHPAATLAVYVATNGIALDTTTEAVANAHGTALVVDDATSLCNHDLAFVVLDRQLSAPIAPVRLGPPATGDVLTAVGFGITELGVLPAARIQRAGVTLVGTGPIAFPDDVRYGAGDAELLAGESACAGDSGSPMLTHATGGAVVGVASRAGNGEPRDPSNAASTCLGPNAHAVYALLGGHQALVLRAFSEAGAKPWLEGQPDPYAVKPAAPASNAAMASGDGSPTPSSPAASEPDDHAATPMTPSGERAGEGPGAGGCSASGEPTHGAVEDALGFAFVLLLVMRLRRSPRAEESDDLELTMREPFASLSDEH